MNIKMTLSQIFQNKNIRFWGLQVFLVVSLLLIGIYATLFSLDSFTRHGKFVVVPDLTHVPLSKAQVLLEKSHLRYEIVDTLEYDPNFPAYAVMEQDPDPNEKVKKDRKIYLKINPENYQEVTIININAPLAEVRPNLESLGLKVDNNIIYVNDIAKDMVLRAFYKEKGKQKEIKNGDKVRKHSIITLECGNGNTLPILDSLSTGGTSEEEQSGNDDFDF